MAPYWADHELASRARALDNRIAHVYVNRVGSEGPHRFVGGSRAVAADGSVLIEASQEDEELLVAALGRPETPQGDLDYLRQARGELPVRARRFPRGGGRFSLVVQARERRQAAPRRAATAAGTQAAISAASSSGTEQRHVEMPLGKQHSTRRGRRSRRARRRRRRAAQTGSSRRAAGR